MTVTMACLTASFFETFLVVVPPQRTQRDKSLELLNCWRSLNHKQGSPDMLMWWDSNQPFCNAYVFDIMRRNCLFYVYTSHVHMLTVCAKRHTLKLDTRMLPMLERKNTQTDHREHKHTAAVAQHLRDPCSVWEGLSENVCQSEGSRKEAQSVSGDAILTSQTHHGWPWVWYTYVRTRSPVLLAMNREGQRERERKKKEKPVLAWCKAVLWSALYQIAELFF